MSSEWTFEGYWNVVFGAYTEQALVDEFQLTDEPEAGHGSIDEWLGIAEAEAWQAGGQGGEIPEEWTGHHAIALKALKRAAAVLGMFPNDLLELFAAATVRDDNGRALHRTEDVFAAISQDLEGTLSSGYRLEYNRARARRLFDEHREALNEAWEKLFGAGT